MVVSGIHSVFIFFKSVKNYRNISRNWYRFRKYDMLGQFITVDTSEEIPIHIFSFADLSTF